MIPQIEGAKILIALAIGVALVACGFATGWTANGWRLGKQVSECKAEFASARAETASAAIADLTQATAAIHSAAINYSGLQQNLTVQFAQLRKDFKDATKTPLPADCKPDTVRMQYLQGAIDSANKASAGR